MTGQGRMILSSSEKGLDRMSGEVLYRDTVEVLEQAAQRGCGLSVPGGAQDQVGWGPGQPGRRPCL